MTFKEFADLYEEYFPDLVIFCMYLVTEEDRCVDIANHSFGKLLHRLAKAPEHPKLFLMITAKTECLNYLRLLKMAYQEREYIY
jgi:DNA-directed RNA polymerase specialized sigma24 family protein